MKTKKMIYFCLTILFSAVLSVQAQTEIRSAKDMEAIGKDRNSKKGSYILMNDLTLENWTPTDFWGTFNGNGHTITLTINSIEINKKMKASSDYASFGLFRNILNSGTVMNLHVTGNIICESNHFILSAGGVAGINAGKIANCFSSVHLKGKGVDQPGSRLVVEVTTGGAKGSSHVMPFDGGALLGGIAGINKGIIINCFAIGNIEVSGDGHKIGGGIAGGNGNDFITGNASSGEISYCYATGAITVHDDDKSRIAGGIAGKNAGMIKNSVALNNRMDVSGKSKSTIFNVCINVANGLLGNNYDKFGISQNGYYRADMSINVETYEDEKAPKKVEPDGAAIDLIAMQQQTWWEKSPGFAFGQSNEKPWIWDDALQRPVLYWEKFDAVAAMMSLSQTSGQLSPDISWRVENKTLIISGNGDMLGKPPFPWLEALSYVTAVHIEDNITSICSYAFCHSKTIETGIIGESVTSLKNVSFSYCKNLKQIEVKSAIPPKMASSVFAGSPIQKAKLIVPAGSKSAYLKDKDWKKFGVIEER